MYPCKTYTPKISEYLQRKMNTTHKTESSSLSHKKDRNREHLYYTPWLKNTGALKFHVNDKKYSQTKGLWQWLTMPNLLLMCISSQISQSEDIGETELFWDSSLDYTIKIGSAIQSSHQNLATTERPSGSWYIKYSITLQTLSGKGRSQQNNLSNLPYHIDT